MSFYNVQTTKVDLGYEVTIRCLYGRLRAIVELADELRERPDSKEIAVGMLAERHDEVCSHGCVDALKLPGRPYPAIVPEVRLEIGRAQVAIQTTLTPLGVRSLHVVLTCPHKTSEMMGEVTPGADQLDAQMELLTDAGRKHRALTGCGCVPDPDDPGEWE